MTSYKHRLRRKRAKLSSSRKKAKAKAAAKTKRRQRSSAAGSPGVRTGDTASAAWIPAFLASAGRAGNPGVAAAFRLCRNRPGAARIREAGLA